MVAVRRFSQHSTAGASRTTRAHQPASTLELQKRGASIGITRDASGFVRNRNGGIALRARKTRSLAYCSQEFEALSPVRVCNAATGEECELTSLIGQEDKVAVVPFLTQFGDFDSFEICQRLNPYVRLPQPLTNL
ncbi:hypothetical protein CYMTET_48221 [Cymbomonas tetramitiformis]|uniref:Uncharacterized protein n=1 Tax=Cymbomonas tetramitiformis TaxID=36881 RepID=A0AAE0BU00_9CHLO|nr:hypothetical protein CYMTET_48221 [Cymbomonas tetramitiformis]